MQIGTFKKMGVGYEGQLHTLTLKSSLTFEPTRNGGAKAPAFRVMNGIREVGIAFKKTSVKGNDYLLVLIDDPAFSKPIWANLITSTENSDIPLMWDRPQPKQQAIAA
jgi:uncharacterized protein (DUF736 family)